MLESGRRMQIHALAKIKFIHTKSVWLQFSDLPERWDALVKTASTIKYEIVPIQAHQIDFISKRITFFNQLSKHFYHEFQEKSVSIKF